MLKTGLGNMEGHGHMEYLAPMLDRNHTARTEARAVTAAINLVQYRDFWIPWNEEICVQRMAESPVHRSRGGDERLAQHLTAENALRSVLGTGAAKDIDLDGLKIEQGNQLIDRRACGGIGS